MRPAIALISGGKDSIYSLHLALWQGFDVRAVGIVLPPPDSMVVQYENVLFAAAHAGALNIPAIVSESGEGEDAEIAALHGVLSMAKAEYDVEWVIVGALASDYQRVRFNYPARDLGLRTHTSIWHLDPKNYLEKLTRDGFEFIVTRVAAEGLDRSWLGKKITEENVDELLALAEKYSFNPAGEGGEYESFVVKTPLYELDVRGSVEGNRFVIEEVAVRDTR